MWVCSGPLEYDGTGGMHGASLRLCGDELLLLVRRSGFEILEEADRECDYTSDELSMLRMRFAALFFVARKVAS